MGCGCNGTPTLSTMTVEQLQAEQDARQERARAARVAYAQSIQNAMQNAGDGIVASAAPEEVSA
jgi:hypothetical protein